MVYVFYVSILLFSSFYVPYYYAYKPPFLRHFAFIIQFLRSLRSFHPLSGIVPDPSSNNELQVFQFPIFAAAVAKRTPYYKWQFAFF